MGHYTCKGSVRGRCGHQHRTVVSAALCLRKDRRECRALGGGSYSDRTVVETRGRYDVPLNDHDQQTLNNYYLEGS